MLLAQQADLEAAQDSDDELDFFDGVASPFIPQSDFGQQVEQVEPRKKPRRGGRKKVSNDNQEESKDAPDFQTTPRRTAVKTRSAMRQDMLIEQMERTNLDIDNME